jgi:hypothetical protein
MSSTKLGSTFVRSNKPFKQAVNMTSQGVSLKPPRFAFVRGVRTAPQMTTSSAFFTPVELQLSWERI